MGMSPRASFSSSAKALRQPIEPRQTETHELGSLGGRFKHGKLTAHHLNGTSRAQVTPICSQASTLYE